MRYLLFLSYFLSILTVYYTYEERVEISIIKMQKKIDICMIPLNKN